MKWKLFLKINIFLCLFFLLYSPGRANDWITENIGDGTIIETTAGRFIVDEVDRVETNLWLPTEDIYYDSSRGKLINLDTNESVYVEEY